MEYDAEESSRVCGEPLLGDENKRFLSTEETDRKLELRLKSSEGSSASSLTSKQAIGGILAADSCPPRVEIAFIQGLNPRLAFAIFAGAFGSAYQHGYATGVVNAPQGIITAWIKDCKDDNSTMKEEDRCEMTEEQVTYVWSLVVSFFCVGGMIGGSCVKLISTTIGRSPVDGLHALSNFAASCVGLFNQKGGLLANNILMALASFLMLGSKYADSFEMLIAGRFVIGVNSGINAGIAPLYLSEISPISLRGAVGSVYQLIITISILLAQILGMRNVLGTENGWPWLFFLTFFPGLIQLATLPFCPESPKYLCLDKNNDGEALRALTWLRGSGDVQAEMAEMKAEQERTKLLPKVTLVDMVTKSALRSPLIIAVMMMLAQQLSGINAAMFFSTSIFKSAGLSESEAQYATLGMGGMNVLMTFVSLALIEIAGRKTLMLAGLGAMLVTTCFILICLAVATKVFSYICIVMVILFVVGFATGPGSIPWFFVTELFQQSARPMATSIAVVTNWSANFLVGLCFEPLKLLLGPYVFLIFIVMQVLFIVYVWFKVPETKNKTIEEITAQFKTE